MHVNIENVCRMKEMVYLEYMMGNNSIVETQKEVDIEELPQLRLALFSLNIIRNQLQGCTRQIVFQWHNYLIAEIKFRI